MLELWASTFAVDGRVRDARFGLIDPIRISELSVRHAFHVSPALT
jgi:hypothetical protein